MHTDRYTEVDRLKHTHTVVYIHTAQWLIKHTMCSTQPDGWLWKHFWHLCCHAVVPITAVFEESTTGTAHNEQCMALRVISKYTVYYYMHTDRNGVDRLKHTHTHTQSMWYMLSSIPCTRRYDFSTARMHMVQHYVFHLLDTVKSRWRSRLWRGSVSLALIIQTTQIDGSCKH